MRIRFLTLVVAILAPMGLPSPGSGANGGPATKAKPGKTSTEPLTASSEAVITAVPFTITAPGVYRLAAPLVGAVDQDGIVIAADDVHLNLGTFTLSGPEGSVLGAGIRLDGERRNVSIQHGALRGWPAGGIAASGAPGITINRVRALDNGSLHDHHGFHLGAGALVENSVSAGNSGAGFRVGDGSSLESCTSTGNSGDGFSMAKRCRVIGNFAEGNSLAGFQCRAGGTNNHIENNSAVGNGGPGFITVNGGNLILRNAASGNVPNFTVKNLGNAHGPVKNVGYMGDIGQIPGAEHPAVNFAY